MTAPREDASALVAFVRKVLAERDETHPHSDYDRESLETGSLNWFHLRALCALVEQGERDRRRLDWLAQELAHVKWDDVFPDFRPREADGEAVEKYISAETFWSHIDAVMLRDASLQPNDSAARTGQEG